MSKKCSKCGLKKNLNEFHFSSHTIDLHSCYCKACKAEFYKKDKQPNNLYVVNEKPLSREKVKNLSAGPSYFEMLIDYKMRQKDISKKYHHSNRDIIT